MLNDKIDIWYDILLDMTTPIDEEQEEDTKQTEEQFLLEPTQTKNGAKFVMVNTRLDYQHRSKDLTALCLYDFVSHFHKKIIDKSDRRLIKNTNGSEGEQLYTEGTKMNERYTFESAHPQSSLNTPIQLYQFLLDLKYLAKSEKKHASVIVVHC